MDGNILSEGTVLNKKYIITKLLYEGRENKYQAKSLVTGEELIIREVNIIWNDYLEYFIQDKLNYLCINKEKQVTPVLDLFNLGDAYYSVEESVVQSSLKQLQKNRRITEREMVDIIIAVLEALKIIHEKDIVHMALCDWEIYLLDDGSVRIMEILNSTPGAYKHNNTCVLLHTGFCAPEQYITRENNIGPWTDIYAIGAIMYKMLTGESLQEAPERTVMDSAKNITTELKGLDKIILKSIALNHKKRYKNVDAMIRALEKCIKKNM